MKKLLRIIFNRWVVIAVGLAAVAAIIWYIGPEISVGSMRPFANDWVRIGLIAFTVLFVAGRLLWSVWKAKRSNAQLAAGLAATNQPPPANLTPTEADTLGRIFEDALGTLRKADLGGTSRKGTIRTTLGRATGQYLYELPWYIIIGAPGAGKTTALIHSGLTFPLADRLGSEKIRGIGGTRNCDWWFTDEGVLLDTAGRYTTQESDREADRSAWQSVLTLLRKHRPRRPINGVLLTVSVADLLQESPAKSAEYAAAARARIQELHEHLGIRFPIYVLVTKCDLLPGFMEFFATLGKEDRAQVWGTTLPLSATGDADVVGGLSSELDLLEQRLNDRLLSRLQEELDPERRAGLYQFPQQFAALREPLGSLLSAVFSPSRFEARPLLRGVYFTSGTQEGSPIDRLIGQLSRSFGLERQMLPALRPTGRSFFITRALRDVIFPEANLAGTNLRWERRRALIEWGAIAAALAIVVGFSLAWMVSYNRNAAYVGDVASRVEEVRKRVEALPVAGTSDAASLVPVLESLRALAATSDVNANSAPFSMGLGLFQGEKLAAASNNAYQRLLVDALLPRLVYRVEEQLRTAPRDNLEYLYEGLKAYLMFFDGERYDRKALMAWIVTDWDKSLPPNMTTDARKALETHANALLQQGAVSSPVPFNKQLVSDTRSALARYPLPERVYSRLRRQGVGSDVPDFRMSDAGGPNAQSVFMRKSGRPLTEGIPGLYTYDGYHKAFLKAAEAAARQLAREESWVLGAAGARGAALAPDEVTTAVRRLYLQDYARNWEQFINDLKVRPGSPRDTARTLSDPASSPLLLLLQAFVKNTTLGATESADKSLVDKATDLVQSQRDNLQQIIGQATGAPKKQVRVESIVDDRFEDLRRFVRGAAAGQPAPINSAMTLLDDLYRHMVAAEAAMKNKTPLPPPDVPNKLKAESARMPDPVKTMVQTVATEGATLTAITERERISAQLASDIGVFCTEAITGRYPFVRSSLRDVRPDDFAALFKPGGKMDTFFQQELAKYADTAAQPWRFRTGSDIALGGSSAIREFQRAAVIRDVFFRGPSIRLEFTPIEMDASITQFLLDVDGQLIRYAHGPQVPAVVQWPGTKGANQVRLQISPPPSTGSSGVVVNGPWALFRLLDTAQIEQSGQPERFRVTFNVEGRKTTFEVVASSVQNPFRLRELAEFQCPTRL